MKGEALADAIAAARGFVADKPDSDRIAVAVFGRTSAMLTGFSSATIDADGALRNVFVDTVQGTALHDVVVMASRSLGAQRLPGRVLILLTDGADQGSKASLKTAIDEARKAGVVVYPIAIVGKSFNADGLMRLAHETGGSYYPAPSSRVLKQVYATIAAELSRTWRLEYLTAARPGRALRLEASVAGVGSATATVKLPGRSTTVEADKPSPLLPDSVYSSRAGTLMLAGAVGLLMLLAGGIALAAKKGARLRSRLDAHIVPQKGQAGKRSRERERFGSAAAGILKATEDAFGHLNAWKNLQRTLERADLPLRTVEFIYIMLGCSFGFGLVAAVAGQSSPVILAAFGGGLVAPLGFVWFKAKQRKAAIENQLPDLLITLAAALKAGHSFRQGIQTLVEEGQPPASDEFKRVLAETRLGRPMDDALAEMAERVGSKNLDFVITAVTIQRQVGGSLAGLFDMVAEAVRQRQQFAR
jgi:tight adherence protein B